MVSKLAAFCTRLKRENLNDRLVHARCASLGFGECSHRAAWSFLSPAARDRNGVGIFRRQGSRTYPAHELCR